MKLEKNILALGIVHIHAFEGDATMNRLFKIKHPNGKSFVVVSRGYTGLIGFFDEASDKESSIAPISLFEFIKYIIKNR